MTKKRRNYTKRTTEEKKAEVENLLKQLDEGVRNFEYDPDRFKIILRMQSLMPNYSFRNIMLIQSQMPNASFVASFKSWKILNRHVLKGQKALRILAPRFANVEDKLTGEEDFKLIGFMPVPVFDVSQTDGDPLPIDELNLTLDGDTNEAVRIFQWTKILAEEDDCKFRVAFANGANGYYSPRNHEIVVDSKLSGNHRAKTAVHELVHSRVHRYNHLHTSAEEMECVAEGTAFIICAHFGLDTSDYTFEYVKGWSSDGGESLLKYGDTIQKAASKLISDYERVATSITTAEENAEKTA